jgi:hypothetical protein
MHRIETEVEELARNDIFKSNKLYIEFEIMELEMSDSINIANLEKPTLRKLLFISNALEQGWSVKKQDESYIFTKKHENKREVFKENYLENFLLTNFSNNIHQ